MKCQTVTFDSKTKFKNYVSSINIMPTMYNRPVSQSHVKTMADSIKKIGIQRGLNVIVTSAFSKDGVQRKYFADGQHLAKAIALVDNKDLFGHLLGFENHVDNIEDIIPYVSQMNSTAKNWTLTDYLNSWCTTGLESYEYIRDLQRETGYSLNGLIEAFSNTRGFGNTTFKQGKFKPNKSVGNKTLSDYKGACEMGLNKGNSSFLAFVRIKTDFSKIDMAHVFNQIQRTKHLFGAKFNREYYLGLFRSYCLKK
jgi:hypothetical protein